MATHNMELITTLVRTGHRFNIYFATFPDLARTGNSPINQSNADVSRNVMESLQAASAPSPTSTTTTTTTAAATSTTSAATSTTTATTSSLSSFGEANNTRGELRALSQRLEMELRARRESPGKLSVIPNMSLERRRRPGA
jgi:hypothetical protein